MNVRKKAAFCRLLVLLLAVFVLAFCQPASALSDALKKRYGDYQVYFYNGEKDYEAEDDEWDDDECVPGTTKPGRGNGPEIESGWGQWTGSCTAMTQERINWLEKQIPDIQAAASKNGIPWELVPAQMFKESGGGKNEVCPYNPLGLKAKNGYKSCNGTFATFSSYKEAYDYYMNNIIPVRAVKNKYPNDPYSAASYIQYGTKPPYASCDSESYSVCVGHMGEPTPNYVEDVTSIICGIQKWAKSKGISISSVTWENYNGNKKDDSEPTTPTTPTEPETPTDDEEEEEGTNVGAIYCDEEGHPTEAEDDDSVNMDPHTLQEYILAWAWPQYKGGGFTQQRAAYRDYMATAPYTGGCKGNDCAAFVSNIMRASGWDSSFMLGSTSSLATWLPSHWKSVSASSLQIGDVGIKSGHVILYVGELEGFGSKTASASLCSRSPMAGHPYDNLNNYKWYRKK